MFDFYRDEIQSNSASLSIENKFLNCSAQLILQYLELQDQESAVEKFYETLKYAKPKKHWFSNFPDEFVKELTVKSVLVDPAIIK